MNPGSALRVLRKEIREGLRDRSLVIYVILIPLFLYPLLGFGIFQIVQVTQGMEERRATTVGVGPGVPAAVRDSLAAQKRLDLVELGDAHAVRDAASFRERRDAEDSLDAVLLWQADTDSAVVYFDESRERSVSAARAIRDAVGDWRRSRAVTLLAAAGLSEADYDLWTLEEEDTASPRELGQKVLSVILPMILLMFLTQGTFYSALDTVVGERERGTLETILTSPATRAEILVGKLLFVVLASVTSLVLNLASLTLFVGFVIEMIGVEDLEIAIGAVPFALILLTALVTAAFCAAVFMVLAIPSRTYREGQAVLTPATLVAIVPGVMVALSQEPFGTKQALIPLINVVALFKSALVGEMPVVPVTLTLVVMTALAAAALVFAARIVANEEVFMEPKMSLKSLLTGRWGGSQ